MTTTSSRSQQAAGVGDATEILTTLREQMDAAAKQGLEVASILRDELIASIKLGQDVAAEAVGKWAAVAGKAYPALPSVPGASELRTTVDAGFDVAEQLFAAQRKLAVTVVETFVPTAS